MSYANEIKIFHYNIKELNSFKIKSKARQIEAVKEVTHLFDFDILSLNEIQFDLPSVPDNNFISRGENLQSLKKLLDLKNLTYESFHPANTGLNAQTKADGTYYLTPNTNEARSHADQINFGTMPGQYSSGALFKYKKIKEIVISDLKWKDFNPNINLTEYRTSNGKQIPDDIMLFDKNFTDATLKVDDKKLHLILLHTVPSYHFGNKKSVNYIRNADQLRFLEWYLTGETDFTVKLENIKPLSKDAYYVAVGDWNTDLSNLDTPGAKVLKRFLKKSKLWLKNDDDISFTNESGGFKKNPTRLMLDYIAYSKNIEIIDAKIIHPIFNVIDDGCEDRYGNKVPKDYVLIKYKKRNKKCSKYVHKSYKIFKEASDHYPIWGHFKLN